MNIKKKTQKEVSKYFSKLGKKSWKVRKAKLLKVVKKEK
jgi:hypothetical protein